MYLSNYSTDARYQIYLNNIEDCYEWTEKHITKKEKDVKDIIAKWLEHQCKIVNNTITDQSNFMKDNNYRCPKDLKNHVIYDIYLHESEFSITTLVLCLDQWLKNTEVVTVNGVELDINKTCSGLDDNLTPECSDEHTTMTPVAMNNYCNCDCRDSKLSKGLGWAITPLLMLLSVLILILIWTCW